MSASACCPSLFISVRACLCLRLCLHVLPCASLSFASPPVSLFPSAPILAYVCPSICLCFWVCAGVCLNPYACLYLRVCLRTYLCLRAFVCASVCVRVSAYLCPYVCAASPPTIGSAGRKHLIGNTQALVSFTKGRGVILARQAVRKLIPGTWYVKLPRKKRCLWWWWWWWWWL